MVLREWEYGPNISPRADGNSDEFKELTRILIANLPGGVRSLTPEVRVLDLNSPWEASFFLATIQHAIGESHSERLIFRGQKRSKWKLVASVDRLKSEEPIYHRALLEYWFFGSILANLHIDLTLLTGDDTSFKLALPPEAYLPIVQHYGTPSPLLDFTADPAVAVYFASRDAEDFAEDTASIYCYRLSSLVTRPELANLRFAPPFFKRPYLQKGVFVEMPASCDDLRLLLKPDIEIRFPILSDNETFRVIREGPVNLEPVIKEMAELQMLAKMGVMDLAFDSDGKEITDDEIAAYVTKYINSIEPKLKRFFKEHLRDPFDYLWTFVDSVEDMLYWLPYHAFDGGLKINLHFLDLVVKSNPQIFRSVITLYEILVESKMGYSIPPDQIPGKKQLIKMFEESLIRVGEKPSVSGQEVFDSLWKNLDRRKGNSQ